MIVDYLGHSGFLIETENSLLLFDYFTGGLDGVAAKDPGKPLFVFSSHAHRDHFQKDIFSLSENGREVRYILSTGIPRRRVPKGEEVLFADPHREYVIPGLGTVRTLLSTDEGVAFLVDTGKELLYHSGDLNYWNWAGEDLEWLSEQERVYREEVSSLRGLRPDAAFAVLDSRLERNCADGLRILLENCAPRYVFPMHYWNDAGVIGRFQREYGSRFPDTEILDTSAATRWETR